MRLMSKAVLLGVVTAVMLILTPASAAAQLDCGEVYTSHSARQWYTTSQHQPRHEMIARTWRTVVSCPLELQTEGWVIGFGTAAPPVRGPFSAEVYKVTLVQPGWRDSTGRHWLIWNGGYFEENWHLWGHTYGRVYIEPAQPESDPALDCMDQGGYWDGYDCIPMNCPIIVDVSGNGYVLTSAKDGVWFDIDGDGIKDRMAWTDPKGDDAFLVMDRNGNGTIDNGTELFGEASPMYAGIPIPTAPNGFDALFVLERPEFGGGPADRIINARDGAFARLQLWRDANHDGISQPNELTDVKNHGITGFDTVYKEKKREDRHGNQFRLKGKLYLGTSERDVWDIWLRRDR